MLLCCWVLFVGSWWFFQKELLRLTQTFPNKAICKSTIKANVSKVTPHLAWIIFHLSNLTFGCKQKKKPYSRVWTKCIDLPLLNQKCWSQITSIWCHEKNRAVSLLTELAAAFMITLAGQISSHGACLCSQRPQSSDSISLNINNVLHSVELFIHIETEKQIFLF